MKLNRKSKIAVGTAAVLAAAGGGVAVASSEEGSRSEDSKAIIDGAAEDLGISPSRLTEALKKALSERVDEAVEAGRLTKDEGDALKERIQSEDFPLFGGGLHRGHLGFYHDLDAAADYLGLSEAELRSELREGKSLADIARDQGKSVDGLVDALVSEAKARLDDAVADGRITQSQANSILEDLRDRIENRVNATGLAFPHFGRSGFRYFGGTAA